MRLPLRGILLGLLVVPALVYGSSELEEEPPKEKFFLKSYQTTTVTTLSIVVTTVPYFCAFTTAQLSVCTGRSLRRKRRLAMRDMDLGKIAHLEKSIDEVPEEPLEEKDLDRLFFTLWQSTTTTVTVTTTATNTSITISALALCTFANYNVPLC
ncbi:uncharacterized protein LOC135203885 [Macrobrachium nipponense]|uniref:uncharacterized protein LOC135203885 n=1 Tax=Macrobrachium nipponense TaxID=159736 RepID=UPI0030C7CB7E